MTTIEIIFPFPPSANTAYPTNARGARHLSKRGKAFKDEAGWIALEALRAIAGAQCITLDIALWFPNKRASDVDNYIKLPKDVICEALHIDDDFTRVPRVVVEYRGIDKAHPRCVVTVNRLT